MRRLLKSFIVLNSLVLLLASCNSGGFLYYLTKGVRYKSLKEPIRLAIYLDDMTYNPILTGAPVAPLYLDNNKSEFYLNELESAMIEKFESDKNITLSLDDADYELRIGRCDFEENIESTIIDDLNSPNYQDVIDLSTISLNVNFILFPIKDPSKELANYAMVSEGESIRERERNGVVRYSKKMSFFDFETLIDRVADKTVSKSASKISNYIRKQQK